MEMLVVLILVAIVGGLLIQGFSYMLQLRQRISLHLRDQQLQQLQDYWIRSVIAGLAPLPDNESYRFSGSRSRMRGLTLGALNAPMGVPRHFNMILKSQGDKQELIYLQGRARKKLSWSLGAWQATEAEFSYLDRRGSWHHKWPLDNPTPFQLPMAIRVWVKRLMPPNQWIIHISGRPNPRIILDFSNKSL